MSSSQSEMWSGTFGHPMAPRKIASWLLIWSKPSLGIMRAGFRIIAAAPGQLIPGKGKAVLARGGLEDVDALGHDFQADAVAGDGGECDSSS